LFYGLYERTQSFFENSDMKAEGLPSEAELALLEPFRDQLPDDVFGEAIVPPVSDGSGSDRALLRKASELLQEAGYRRQGADLIGPDGNPLEIEFLNNTTVFEKITNPVIKNLERLGIKASLRIVDPAQYQSRMNDYDFDIASRRFSLSPTLSDSIREIWGSRAAETPGTYNVAGISSPVVDALIDRIIAARSREEMNTGARALDRVLRSGYYWIPHWFKSIHTVALWDVYGYPEKIPRYAFPIEELWWIEKEKAAKLGKAG
ncbi:ABC transporter substrate-binding protein, partial [Roseibium sp.]|uniref:ABC transporter substrate-binding protein n=1 Tax=Roseibium sp. TaxID=1936156 RepID=UPI003D11604A